MREAARFLAVASVLVALGCSNAEPTPALGPSSQSGAMAPAMTAGRGAAGTTPNAANSTGGAAPAANAGAGGGSTTPLPNAGGTPMETGGTGSPVAGAGGADAPPGAYDYAMQQVTLSADLVIAKGETVRVGPGTTFSMGNGVKVRVEGTLIVAGTAEAEVRFVGAGAEAPRTWHSIEIADGGRLELTHAAIGAATYGIHALPGSSYAIDYADIGTSFKAAVLEADGSVDHTRFHASGDPTFSAVNEVSIDDVNGTLTIIAASPTVSNSTFDGSSALVDMVRVGGNASPVFDHCHLKDAHCGIHANGGTNNTPVVKNSIFENMAYGLMVYATKPTIEDSAFIGNANDIGFCYDATEQNVPTLTRNFYSAGMAGIDPSCFQIGADDPNPLPTKPAGVGPVGL